MKRAFTLVELACVLPLVTVMGSALLWLLVTCLQECRTIQQRTDLRLEAYRASRAIFRREAAGPWHIDADQRGIAFGDGSHLRLNGQRLELDGRPLMSGPVREFLAVRRDGRLTVHLGLRAPAWARGRDREFRFVFDEPVSGEERRS